MHRFIGNDLFKDVRRGRPVDRLQDQEAGVEPHAEKRLEPAVQPCRRRVAASHGKDAPAQPDQPHSAAVGRVQSPEQFHPARLGKAGDTGKSARIGIFAIGIRRPCQRRRVEVVGGSQMIDKRLELRLVHALDSVEKPRGIDK